MDIRERQSAQYEAYLAYQRGKIVDPLGELAVASFGAPLGLDVPRFESETPERTVVEFSPRQTRSLAAPALRQEMRITQQPRLDTAEVYLGYAA